MSNNSYVKSTYTKLFQKILTSTIWGEDDRTRIVWITLLAMSDSEGCVLSSVAGLSRMANVPVEDARRAVEKFLLADPDSTTPDHEGRRIEVIEGGWRLLNHAKYKGMMTLEHRREYNRLKQAEYRRKVGAIDRERTLRQELKRRGKMGDFMAENE